MRIYPASAAVLVFSSLAASSSQAQSLEEVAIRKLGDRYVEAFNKGDAKALSSLYDTDAVFIDEGGFVSRGKVEILKAYSGIFAFDPLRSGRLTLAQGPIRFLKPDVALSDGTFQVAGVKGPDGRLLPPTKGLYSNAFVKKGGQWVLATVAAFVPAE